VQGVTVLRLAYKVPETEGSHYQVNPSI